MRLHQLGFLASLNLGTSLLFKWTERLAAISPTSGRKSTVFWSTSKWPCLMTKMNGGKAPACVPTWRGHIETTKDALLVFEACFNGTLAHCFRRPHDRERNQLIVSGNVFVYEEATSGIKRWTDGIPWSPSRILTNFLIYRQLNAPFPPGEKKRATKRGQRPTRPGEPYPSSSSRAGAIDDGHRFSSVSPATPGFKREESGDRDANRGLLGSLVDSYEFKENGLLKKTMTVVINHVQHHLVSYYTLHDAKNFLNTPKDDARLKNVILRPELLHQPKFKFANFDDSGDGAFDPMDASQQDFGYYPPSTGYDSARHMSISSQGHASHQEASTQSFFPSMNQFVSPIQPPNSQISYPSMLSTPSTYGSMPTALSTYSQHHQQHNIQHHIQQNSHPAPQPALQFHQNAPYPHYVQHQHRAIQVSFPEHQNQPNGFLSQSTHNLLPKPIATFDFNSASQESYNQGHDHEYYSAPQPSIPPSAEGAPPRPQQWQQGALPAPFPSHTAPSYPTKQEPRLYPPNQPPPQP